MTKTSIEWATDVWNPTTGCDRVSPGCDNCYALTLAKRLKGMGSKKYQRDGDPRTSGPGFGLSVHSDVLWQPMRWRTPKRIFVNSMSDLFHEEVPDRFIADVFAVMALSPQHIFQILTKRHGRMRSLLNSPDFRPAVQRAALVRVGDRAPWLVEPWWPLANVWLGVSVEDQKWADIRIPALLDTPAAVRWISAEPLLGPVRLADGWLTQLRSVRTGIDWLVVGGESGPGARPMHPDWARGLRDQCASASVPFFFKQWGEWAPNGWRGIGNVNPRERLVGPVLDDMGHRAVIERKGKKAAGRELDGRTWDEYPG